MSTLALPATTVSHSSIHSDDPNESNKGEKIPAVMSMEVVEPEILESAEFVEGTLRGWLTVLGGCVAQILPKYIAHQLHRQLSCRNA
jgi:hypothetical protein